MASGWRNPFDLTLKDRISNLPDDILHEILSSLNLKQAIRTSILSRRWRRMWCTNPSVSLSFPFPLDASQDPDKYASIVSSCLAACENNQSIKSLSVHINSDLDDSILHRWINFAKDKSVKSLSLFFHGVLDDAEIDSDEPDEFVQNGISEREIPIQIFSISSLEYLHLKQCNIPTLPVNLGDRPLFPKLETLFFDSVLLNEESLSGFISTSPQLKNLEIAGVECEDGITISCPTLENLVIRKSVLAIICEINILEVPNLRVLRLCCNLENVVLTGLSECTELPEIAMFCKPEVDFWDRDDWRELISQISCARTLSVDYWLMMHLLSEDEDFGSRPPVFSNLRELQICGGPFAITWYRAIIDLLRECPILEKLEFQGCHFDAGSTELTHARDEGYIPEDYDFEDDDIIREFENSTNIAQNLKTVLISGHFGYKYLIKLMYFILSHADILEEVYIDGEENQFQELLEFDWLSSELEININGDNFIQTSNSESESKSDSDYK